MAECMKGGLVVGLRTCAMLLAKLLTEKGKLALIMGDVLAYAEFDGATQQGAYNF